MIKKQPMKYKTEESECHKCLECGDIIEYGRTDKKFCSELCKNRYHNKRARGRRLVRLKVITALNKNYGILDNLLNERMTEMSVIGMKCLGFDFEYFTSCHKIRRHNVFSCFDITFAVVGEKVMYITRLSPPRKCEKSQNDSLNLPDIPPEGEL